MKGTITVPVKLDEKTFKRFSRFDMFRLRKRWRRPMGFALILIAFAVIALVSGKAQAAMLASVLLVVGLGLPLVYFGTFFSQVNLQAVRQKLKPARPVYTVRLDGNGVRVTNDQREEAPVRLRWSELQAAFRAKGCIYLYVNAARAFLLPDGQANVSPDELWACLQKQMGGRARRA